MITELKRLAPVVQTTLVIRFKQFLDTMFEQVKGQCQHCRSGMMLAKTLQGLGKNSKLPFLINNLFAFNHAPFRENDHLAALENFSSQKG